MKKMILFLLLATSVQAKLQAQTFAEWFQQKKTQNKYMVQQIAALQLYIGFAEKGYQIVKQGINTVSDFTKGEFDLHENYFNSLKTVNPVIKQSKEVAVFADLLAEITNVCNRTYQVLNNSMTFSRDEMDYFQNVFRNLLNDVDKTTDVLITIISDDKLKMTDDERMARIEKLHSEMQEKLVFSRSFSADAKSIAASRVKEKADSETSHVLHSIKTILP